MELIAYSPSLTRIGVVDTVMSLQWIRRYNEAGAIELHCSLDYLDILTSGNLLQLKGVDEACIIESFEIIVDEDGKEKAVVRGPTLSGLLQNRIVWDVKEFSGNAETLMRELVTEACISPTDTDRAVGNLTLGVAGGYTETIEFKSEQSSDANLLTELIKISQATDIGFRVKFTGTGFVFETYKGQDRTVGTIGQAVFSREFDTLLSQEFLSSLAAYKNVARVRGEDSDPQVFVEVDGGQTGWLRREIFVDANGVKKDALTTEQYALVLAQKGLDKLHENSVILNYTGNVNPFGSLVYRTDYDLGDLVTIQSDWGISVDTRITEATEIYESGFDVRLEFGKPISAVIRGLK